MASASVVAELCDELVPASPVGPVQCVINGGNFRQYEANYQTPDFRDGDGDEIRALFFDVFNTARDRITASVA